MGKVGRNSQCPCGSGLKHKKCCGSSGSTPLHGGAGELLGTPIGQLAKPKCSKCFGRGYTGVRIAQSAGAVVGVHQFCSCIKEKYFEKYRQKLADEAAKKSQEESTDENNGE